LAPIVVRDLYAAIPGIKAAGTTVVIVEQDVTLALEIADHVYCMLEGRISLSGTPATLSHTAVTDAYFGVRA
jgi:branched-chain amino acid transport system ATP-binding protein